MDDLIPISEFARRVGVCRGTAYRMLHRGDLKAVKVGKKTMIPIEAERAWRASLPRWKPRQKSN